MLFSLLQNFIGIDMCHKVCETWLKCQFLCSNSFSENSCPAGICLLKVYNRTYFTPCSSVSIVNFEHVIAG